MFQSGFIFEAPHTIGKPTPASGKPKKTRASCDACSKSKIKCGQQRPECIRCAKLGIPCNYSLSRRIGKPAGSGKKKKIQHPPSPSSVPTAPPPQNGSTSSDATARSHHASQSLFNVLPTHLGVLEPRSTSVETTSPNHGFFKTTASYFDEAHIKSRSPSFLSDARPTPLPFDYTATGTTLLDPTIAPPPMLGSDLMETDFALSDEFSEFPGSDTSSFAMGDGLSTPPSSCSSHFSSGLDFSDGIPPPCTKLSLLDKFSPSVQDIQNGMGQGLAILFSLHDPTNLPAGGFRTIDSLLDTNRQALDSLTSLLGDLCQSEPEGCLLVALIITKLLNSYKCITQTRPTPSASRSRSSSLQSQGSNHSRTPVKLGSYALDEEDEECIKMQLVLSQLKRLEKLIERFMEILNVPGRDPSPALKTFVTGTFDEVLSEARRTSSCTLPLQCLDMAV